MDAAGARCTSNILRSCRLRLSSTILKQASLFHKRFRGFAAGDCCTSSIPRSHRFFTSTLRQRSQDPSARLGSGNHVWWHVLCSTGAAGSTRGMFCSAGTSQGHDGISDFTWQVRQCVAVGIFSALLNRRNPLLPGAARRRQPRVQVDLMDAWPSSRWQACFFLRNGIPEMLAHSLEE